MTHEEKINETNTELSQVLVLAHEVINRIVLTVFQTTKSVCVHP